MPANFAVLEKKAGVVTDEETEPTRHPTLREFARAYGCPFDHAYREAIENPSLVIRVAGGRGPLGWSYRVADPERLAAAVAERPRRGYNKTPRPRSPEPRTRDPEVDHALA